ncbi:MAG: OmpA family protein, partial [Treponema sp.]|nr:OmpA family protein [Treponema sp.]
EKWTASSVRVVDPMNTGEFTRIPFTAEYTYLKDDVYNGTEVYIVSAKWATRYGFLSAAEVPADTEGDPLLDRATCSHSATIAISKESGAALVVRDTVDESFFYKDGRKVDFKGTISLFTNYPPAVDRKKIITSVKKEKLPPAEVPVEETPAGLKISIKNLQFKPDSDQLLESEKERLDKIASVLLNAKDSSFLVEGHTASTGNPSGEMSLSIKRARAIASELSKRGIPAEKFICKGWGATKPLADNSTPEGMAQNRRVEITILE